MGSQYDPYGARAHWIVLEKKHPATWDRKDLETLIKHIREKRIVPYNYESSIRAWFKFIDATDDRGRKLLDHPLLEASREKMTNPKTKYSENDGISKNFLDPEEFMNVLNETDEILFKAMLWVHVTTGCRVGITEAPYERGRGGLLRARAPRGLDQFILQGIVSPL